MKSKLAIFDFNYTICDSYIRNILVNGMDQFMKTLISDHDIIIISSGTNQYQIRKFLVLHHLNDLVKGASHKLRDKLRVKSINDNT